MKATTRPSKEQTEQERGSQADDADDARHVAVGGASNETTTNREPPAGVISRNVPKDHDLPPASAGTSAT